MDTHWSLDFSAEYGTEVIQPLREINTRNIPGGKGRLACKTDNPIITCKPIF
jgi:hypothetical protein